MSILEIIEQRIVGKNLEIYTYRNKKGYLSYSCHPMPAELNLLIGTEIVVVEGFDVEDTYDCAEYYLTFKGSRIQISIDKHLNIS